MKIFQFLLQQAHNKLAVGQELVLKGNCYILDANTNLTNKIISLADRNLINQEYHPLTLIKQKIRNFFYINYLNSRKNPIFSIHDNISPVVSVNQNFDELFISKEHPSRSFSESYYINTNCLLRTHTSAHQISLIRAGLNSFLIAGDVYRRDAIDSTHYPVFHQLEGVRLFTRDELFAKIADEDLKLFQNGVRNEICQENHSIEASKLLEFSLKRCLENLTKYLFGPKIEMRWVNAYFPFTHPSWELEIKFEGEFMEVLGCGIIEQKILEKAGALNRVGWAFGLGLERLAMLLYNIPDIRLFWSKDSGFLNQFKTDDPEAMIKLKPISKFPQCVNNISFWLPEQRKYNSNDFYDLVRSVSSVTLPNETEQIDLVEQVNLIDTFVNKSTGRESHCYQIIYRHPRRTLTKELVNSIHGKIEEASVSELGVTLRNNHVTVS